MEKKEENPKDNRFTYSSDEGLKVLSEKDILESIGSEKEIKKSIIIIDIEKAWKSLPIGTIQTRKDGQKYKKVSETGNPAKDWELVTKDKTGGGEGSKAKEHQHKPEDLKEQAKNTSETALQNAIKQSDDPKIRQAAHEELDRREKEEHVQEDKKQPLDEQSKTDSIFDKKGSGVSNEFTKDIITDIKKLKNSVSWEISEGIIAIDRENRKLFDESDMKNLSEDEKRFLIGYLTNSYGKINEELRSGIVSEDVEIYVKHLKTAIEKLDDYSGNVYRSISFDNLGKIKAKKELDKLLNFYKQNKGKEIVENQFISSGKDKNRIKRKFERNYSLNFSIISKTGKDISHFNDEEKEVLFNIGSKFKVISVSGNNVKLEQVENSIKKSEDNQLKGGKGDKHTIKSLAKKHNVTEEVIKNQIKQGILVELEHTKDTKIALEIVMDHLTESAEYYTKLREMEKEFKDE